MENKTESFSSMVPLQKLSGLKDRLSSLNKRAQKLGFQKITLSYGRKEVRHEKYFDTNIYVTYIECIISGEYPRFPGYKFLARLQREGERNMVYPISEESFNSAWVTQEGYCDHCKTNRARKETYIIRKEEDGKILQIGSDCVDAFIGGSSLSSIAMRASIYNIFSDMFEGVDDSWKDAESFSKVIDLEEFIAAAIAATRNFGYISRAQAEESSKKRSTASMAWDILAPRLPNQKYDIIEFAISSSDRDLAKEALSNLNGAIGDTFNGSLRENIKTICSNPEIHVNNINTAALLAKAALTNKGENIGFEKAKKKEIVVGEFLGEVGSKIQTVVTVKDKYHKDSFYSAHGTNLITMEDDLGNTIMVDTGGVFSPKIDSRIEIKGTVKKHHIGKRSGKKQTYIMRPSIVRCSQTENALEILNRSFEMTYGYEDQKLGEGDIYSEMEKILNNTGVEISSFSFWYELKRHEESLLAGRMESIPLEIRAESSLITTLNFDLTAKRIGNFIHVLMSPSSSKRKK